MIVMTKTWHVRMEMAKAARSTMERKKRREKMTVVKMVRLTGELRRIALRVRPSHK